MRILIINLPHETRVQRRFRCSYRAPHFLFPPLEMLSVGGTLKEKNMGSVRLIDAIAEDWDIERVVSEVGTWKPDAIVTMPGFEILDDDLRALSAIQKAAPDARVVLFGHLPTCFPEEIIELSGADAVIIGEPEKAVADALEGLARGNDERKQWEAPAQNVDELPYPDYSLVSLDPYGDFLFPRPFAALQTSRGCPFNCIYCVRPYGRRVTYRSPERIVEEVRRLVKDYGVRGLRFEDDTFPLDSDRAAAIARGIAPLGVEWSCLSRPDTIDYELARELRNGGCRRVYLGIESASDRLLEWLGRGHTARQGLITARAIKKAGMEVAGFFLVGIPGETEDEFRKAVELARRAKLDYIGVSTLIPYPGTALFEQNTESVSFNLSPFKSHFIDEGIRLEGRRREKAFYRMYYYSPRYLVRGIRAVMRNPADAFRSAAALTRHLVSSRGEGKHGDLI